MGTWDYAFLDPVPPAENSMRRIAALLTGPLCGWPRDRLLVLENEATPGDLPDRLITAFDGITDVALFYYTGHGQISPDDQLCLGLTQSRPEAIRRAATSLRFTDVRQALLDSGAAVKIVILDCCFAGLATVGASALAGQAGDVLDMTAGTGAYTMAATGAYATAWYEHGPGQARPQTYFSKYLADLIEHGIPGQPSLLRLDGLYRQLRDNLASDRRPEPRSRAVDDARDFVFAYNAAPPHTHRDPERELVQLSQRLAESEDLRAAADVRIRALEAEAALHAKELARLNELTASDRPRSAEQQRELDDAIDETARQLADTRAAQAAAVADYPSSPAGDGRQEPPISDLAGQQAGSPPLRGTAAPPIARPVELPRAPNTRGRLRVRSALAGAAFAAASVAALFLLLPGGGSGRSPATMPPSRTPPASTPAISGPITGSLETGLPNPKYDPFVVAFAPGGKILAVGSWAGLDNNPSNGSTYLWDIATRKVTATLTDPNSEGVFSVAFGPGGSTLATGDSNGSVYLWDIATRKIATTLTDPNSGGVDSVAFGPDGTLAAGNVNGSVYLWDIATRKIATTLFDPNSGIITSVVFGPGGSTLAAGDVHGGVYLWDIATRKVTATLTDPNSGGVYSVVFGPGGSTLAAGDDNSRVHLWDIATRKVTATLTDPNGKGVYSVVFGPGGSTLAAGDVNGSVYLWDIATRKVTATLTDPNSKGVYSVAFGPGGTTLAAGDSNGSTYLWKIVRLAH